MEKTLVPLSEAYKIADKMSRPWHWTAGVLAFTVAGLLTYLLVSDTVATAEINAEHLKAAVLNTLTTLGAK